MPPARLVFFILTCGALALCVRSFWLGPVPLPLAISSLFLYLVVVFSGYVFPRWGMFASVVDEALPGRNLVALTFDDGPDAVSTPKVLDALAEHGAKATFFVIARKAELYPEIVARIVTEGHELALHGYCHSRLTAFRSAAWIRKDLERARSVLLQWLPAPPRWLRPPIGHVTPRLAAVAKELNLVLVCWTIRGLDGLPGVATDKVIRRVSAQLRDGAIIALHDAFESESGETAGARALPQILSVIDQKQLRSVTLTELLEG